MDGQNNWMIYFYPQPLAISYHTDQNCHKWNDYIENHWNKKCHPTVHVQRAPTKMCQHFNLLFSPNISTWCPKKREIRKLGPKPKNFVSISSQNCSNKIKKYI